MQSEGSSIQAARIVTFGRGADDEIRMVFMAQSVRPASLYAEPTVAVLFQEDQQPPAINSSATTIAGHQQTTLSHLEDQHRSLIQQPWFDDPYGATAPAAGQQPKKAPSGSKFMANTSNATFLGWWTFPYFLCSSRNWQMTYSIPLGGAAAAAHRYVIAGHLVRAIA